MSDESASGVRRRLGAARDGATRTVSKFTQMLPASQVIEPVAPDDKLLPWVGDDNPAALAALRDADPLAGQTNMFPGLAIDPDAIVLGGLVLAGSIARQAEDFDRQARMNRAVAIKLGQLLDALDLKSVGPYQLLGEFCGEWTPAQQLTLLIELAAGDPFAPYQIDWNDNHRNSGLACIAEQIGLTPHDVQRVLNTFVDAARAHRDTSLLRIGVYTVAGAAALGGAGMLAAPMLGGALGAATGLGGAAATSHGLALIGGMAGTSSVSAGTWLVTQAGVAAGAVGAGAGAALFQLGAAQTQAELVKLQVAAKLVLVDLQKNDAAAHQIAAELDDRLGEIEQRITEELEINDPDSSRIGELRDTARALEDAGEWVEGHCSDDHGGLTFDTRVLADDFAGLEQRLRDGDAFASLAPGDQARIFREISADFTIHADLDRWDVAMGIAAGVAAALIDAFVVSSPKSSPITTVLRQHARDPKSWLENFAKVPFDQSVGNGFTPNTHRVLTPGHDPVLGLVWGTSDILHATMTRTMTSGEFAVVAGSDVAPPDTLVEALLIQIAHLLSDVVTPAGLPLPGFTLLPTSERFAEAAVKAYREGYDTWHLPAMSLPVATVRSLVFGYQVLRSEHDDAFASTTSTGSDSARIRAIELIALGISTAADAAELVVTGNPLKVNYVQWLTLARRITIEAHARSQSVATALANDLEINRQLISRRWSGLIDD